MNNKIVLTGIIRNDNKYLIVKRSENDDFMGGSWEFPGGNLNNNELLVDGLKREIMEEIGVEIKITPKIINYYDEIKNNRHYMEFDFLIDIDHDIEVTLSDEHSEYKWVLKDSDLIDEYIKSKLKNI